MGKFDLQKPVRYWGLDGWVDDLGKLGFTRAIDNEGKMDGYGSGKNQPNGSYMKYLYDNDLQKIHLNDYDRRSIGKHDTRPTDLPEEAYCDNWLTGNGIELLREFNRNQPWFLQVNFTSPHNPWDITKRMKDKWKDLEFPQPFGNDNLEPEKHNEIRQNFAAMLENIDRNIGILIDEVDKRGELENTIIIYTSDHGNMLGDKNLFGKSVPYRGSVSIPLVKCGNGIRRDVLSEIPVELQDLAATITDFYDLSMPEAKNSKSLKNYLTEKDESPVRNFQTSALWDWNMIINSEQKSIYRKGKLAEVYDTAKDIWEANNLVDIHCE